MGFPINKEDTREDGEMVSIDLLLSEFITYLATVRNYAPNTLRTYESLMTRFVADCNITDLKQIQPPLVENYFAERIKAGHTQNSNFNFMVAIRCFLMFCTKRGYSDARLDLFEVPKRTRVRVEYITADEVNRMLEVTPRERDRLMILILYTSGCRVGELVQLTVESLKDNRFTVIAKGNKPHVYYMDMAVADRLREFLHMENITSGPVFRNTLGRPVGPPAISNAIRKAVKEANIQKRVHPHTFRHGFATALLENGADPRTVQEMLGHENIQTTMRYMHVTDNRMRESHNQFAPKVTPVKNYFEHKIPLDKNAYGE